MSGTDATHYCLYAISGTVVLFYSTDVTYGTTAAWTLALQINTEEWGGAEDGRVKAAHELKMLLGEA
eukprot:2929006-Rhodomonas_salina.2